MYKKYLQRSASVTIYKCAMYMFFSLSTCPFVFLTSLSHILCSKLPYVCRECTVNTFEIAFCRRFYQHFHKVQNEFQSVGEPSRPYMQSKFIWIDTISLYTFGNGGRRFKVSSWQHATQIILICTLLLYTNLMVYMQSKQFWIDCKRSSQNWYQVGITCSAVNRNLLSNLIRCQWRNSKI